MNPVNIYVYRYVDMSAVISIRIDDQIKQSIEELGYKPSEFLKKILFSELKKEQAKKALNWIKNNRIKTKGKMVEELIREDREA